MQLFQTLGEDIEAAWSDQNYDERVFPAISAAALKEANIPAKISAWDVIRWTLDQTELPRQKDVHAKFAEPPITMFVAPRFYIDVYVWLEGTTATHQHSFCGAFQVFLGSSIHSWHTFKPSDRINTFVEIGEMSLRTCELLEVGDVQEILPGRQYVHSLFHLDQPSVTIVVRTDRSPLELPQFSYHRPSLAIDPFYEHETTTKKLQTIAALFRSKHPDTDQLIIDLLAKSDFHTSYLILATANTWLSSDQLGQMFNAGASLERFAAMLDAVEARHGSRAQVIRQVFERNRREMELIRRRNFITNPEHRFFLALLLNVTGKETIYSLIAKRFPGSDPVEKILDWTFDLSETRIFGAGDANALGITDFDNSDLLVLEGLLRDQSEADLRESIANDHQNEAGNRLLEGLNERIRNIREAVIFRPLFS